MILCDFSHYIADGMDETSSWTDNALYNPPDVKRIKSIIKGKFTIVTMKVTVLRKGKLLFVLL